MMEFSSGAAISHELVTYVDYLSSFRGLDIITRLRDAVISNAATSVFFSILYFSIIAEEVNRGRHFPRAKGQLLLKLALYIIVALDEKSKERIDAAKFRKYQVFR